MEADERWCNERRRGRTHPDAQADMARAAAEARAEARAERQGTRAFWRRLNTELCVERDGLAKGAAGPGAAPLVSFCTAAACRRRPSLRGFPH
jgi:hypothetical protein